MSNGTQVSTEIGASPRPIVLLDAPRDGTPPVVADQEGLERAVSAFAAGHGPVAVDAERASGHRYGQRAFLVQLRREGAGTALVDPSVLPDLSPLGEVLQDTEWVLHAASQDLPCLAEVGLRPKVIFDTELAARLAGYPRVGLAAMVEQLLGLRLAKEHSAADWSQRPLPEPWLRYAALDVEVLVALRDLLAEDLREQGKLEWAREEFAAIVTAPSPTPRVDPWRRTSGLHRVRNRRQLAVVRELWNERDAVARERDLSPGRVLPDSAIVEAALAQPPTAAALVEVPGFTGRGARRYAGRWAAAVRRSALVPDDQLPPQHLPPDGPPPARLWADRDPVAAARLTAVRSTLVALATEHRLPVENLLAPELARRLAWEPPVDPTPETVGQALQTLGARSWQVRLVAGPLAEAMVVPAESGE
jgi:ribonuclease D